MRQNGLRITPHLEAILDYLISTREHPSARRIFEVVCKKVPGISLSTVYNVLNRLQESNVVSVLEFEQLENRYDGNTVHHWNLVCLNCHKIFDLTPVQTLDKEQIKKTARFEVFRSRFELYGLCNGCSKENRQHQGIRCGRPDS